MPYTDQFAGLETETIARWRLMAPMMPSNGDLKGHLANRRSLSDVLAKRRSLIEAIASTSRSPNVVPFQKRPPTDHKIERRLAG